jgi:hypothetical protein
MWGLGLVEGPARRGEGSVFECEARDRCPDKRSVHQLFAYQFILSESFADFIVGLEADYPSTVSTIASTCAKVEPKEEPDAICVMCERYASHLRDA